MKNRAKILPKDHSIWDKFVSVLDIISASEKATVSDKSESERLRTLLSIMRSWSTDPGEVDLNLAAIVGFQLGLGFSELVNDATFHGVAEVGTDARWIQRLGAKNSAKKRRETTALKARETALTCQKHLKLGMNLDRAVQETASELKITSRTVWNHMLKIRRGTS